MNNLSNEFNIWAYYPFEFGIMLPDVGHTFTDVGHMFPYVGHTFPDVGHMFP